ncbi:hypothetical protein M011DRAFT_80132 [Sporormia fimetaria CBS 119925]|uniref:Uncharacterized protein n=1 Tax=Sporormia fimetaria CBS 119925 TaxID=1340428 RepID=A0A6A6V9M3_9PLEO|nr:hypothetical protein M011DRAFT_80132 [Sporormia fimetaria CBS 119925]
MTAIMATSKTLQTIPRFLLPRSPFLFRARAFPLQATPLSVLRHASSIPNRSSMPKLPLKPRVIPQPDKYRPPSHGKRTPRSETLQKSYGPKLSEEDKVRMETKKYPNMMAPKGSFMYWFLNNIYIHMFITIVR